MQRRDHAVEHRFERRRESCPAWSNANAQSEYSAEVDGGPLLSQSGSSGKPPIFRFGGRGARRAPLPTSHHRGRLSRGESEPFVDRVAMVMAVRFGRWRRRHAVRPLEDDASLGEGAKEAHANVVEQDIFYVAKAPHC